MQLNNQRSTLDVMDFIFTLQEETKLKLKVATLLWCWWNARNKTNQIIGERKYTNMQLCFVSLLPNAEVKIKSAPLRTKQGHVHLSYFSSTFYQINNVFLA